MAGYPSKEEPLKHNLWWRQDWIACTVTAVALTLSATACTFTGGADRPSNDPSRTSSSSGAGDVPVLLDTASMRLPLDVYLPTLKEEDQRSAAHGELIRRCMQRFGIKITIPEPPAAVGIKSLNERRYGLTDAAAAAKLGYGLGERDPSSRPPDPGQSPALTPKALAVLSGKGSSVPSGVPNGGCQGEAQRRLALVDPSSQKAVDENLAQRMSLDTFQRSQEDPRVVKAYADWASCMGAEGHDYKKPLDPLADPKFRPAGSAKERDTAKDDVACKQSTNLVGRWYAVESAYQTALIQDHRTELEALARAAAANRDLVRTLAK
jgi:hypothetical protein